MSANGPVRLMILDTSPANSGGANLLFYDCSHFDPRRVRATMVLHEDNAWAERYRSTGAADVIVETDMLQSGTIKQVYEQAVPGYLRDLSAGVAHMIPAVLRLAREVEHRRIDVVMGLCDTPAILSVFVGLLTRRPVIMHLVSTYLHPLAPAALTAFGLLPVVRRVVQLSQYSASQFPRLRRKTVTIHSGIDYAAMQRPLVLPLRTAHGIPPDAPLVGIAGRFVDVKGMDVFARAAARIAARAPDVRFFMLGDDRGDYGDSVHALVRRLGLAERVVFTGFVDDMHAALADLDVVVVPSRRECAPLVIYESMALGKPVVASNVHGIPELVHDGTTGLLVPVEDDAAVAEAVLTLLRDRGRRLDMGVRARDRVRDRFDSVRAVRQLEDVVTDAAAEGIWPWSPLSLRSHFAGP
jgi:glycosyltransferase involved in cell wall biosynthesis